MVTPEVYRATMMIGILGLLAITAWVVLFRGSGAVAGLLAAPFLVMVWIGVKNRKTSSGY